MSETQNAAPVAKVISGGQTGADRAALDAALAAGVLCGGAVPRGRLAEDGPVPARYAFLEELNSPYYRDRTERNVRDADATLVFTAGRPSRGTALTLRFLRQHARPFLLIDRDALTAEEAAARVREWLRTARPAVLNVAGPRESGAPGMYAYVRAVLEAVLPA